MENGLCNVETNVLSEFILDWKIKEDDADCDGSRMKDFNLEYYTNTPELYGQNKLANPVITSKYRNLLMEAKVSISEIRRSWWQFAKLKQVSKKINNLMKWRMVTHHVTNDKGEWLVVQYEDRVVFIELESLSLSKPTQQADCLTLAQGIRKFITKALEAEMQCWKPFDREICYDLTQKFSEFCKDEIRKECIFGKCNVPVLIKKIRHSTLKEIRQSRHLAFDRHLSKGGKLVVRSILKFGKLTASVPLKRTLGPLKAAWINTQIMLVSDAKQMYRELRFWAIISFPNMSYNVDWKDLDLDVQGRREGMIAACKEIAFKGTAILFLTELLRDASYSTIRELVDAHKTLYMDNLTHALTL